MSTTQPIVTHWRTLLPVAAAILATGLTARAQAPDASQSATTNASASDNSQPAAETNQPASTEAKSGNILGKVNAGKGLSVVWVEATPALTSAGRKKSITVSQKNLKFEPHVLAVPVGASVNFLNGDAVAHNIFWPAISGNKKLSHSLGTWPKGQTRAFQFTTPGIVPLLCNVHPEMSAWLIVTPTSWLAETDESGSYKIADIPDGSYKVTAWHEGYKTQTKPVTVASDAKLDFTLTK